MYTGQLYKIWWSIALSTQIIAWLHIIFEKDGYLGYLCTSYSYTFKVSSTVIRKAREVAITVHVLILHEKQTCTWLYDTCLFACNGLYC